MVGARGLLAALLTALWATGAAAACRQALVLALDVSGSVDAIEYNLQINGVADALTDPDVVAALLALPDAPVHLAIFEWSSAAYQSVILDWTALESPERIAAVAERLRRWPRKAAPEATGLGAALRFAARMLREGPLCWKRVVDVSGDGKNNDWPRPELVHGGGELAGATVNGLVVGQMRNDDARVGVAELSAYFKARVIHGPLAFVEVALGYADYAAAMRRKLLKELNVGVFSALPLRPSLRVE